YAYANKDAVITGIDDDNAGMIINLILKRGWNSLIIDWSVSPPTMKNGSPDDSFKWIVDD
ncbi:MAG: hypothetical protein LBK13_09820, partial [Spirochaetales bacterium]|nr:hypothetical protein [Spirochaetales bacterium]